jgi:hypothetical protein
MDSAVNSWLLLLTFAYGHLRLFLLNNRTIVKLPFASEQWENGLGKKTGGIATWYLKNVFSLIFWVTLYMKEFFFKFEFCFLAIFWAGDTFSSAIVKLIKNLERQGALLTLQSPNCRPVRTVLGFWRNSFQDFRETRNSRKFSFVLKNFREFRKIKFSRFSCFAKVKIFSKLVKLD